MPATAALGVTASFNGTSYDATSISVNQTTDLIDGSHMGLAVGAKRPFVSGLAGNAEVTIEFLGGGLASVGSSGSVSITGGGLSYSGTGTCMASSISGSVGDLAKGSVTIRV